MAVHAPWSSSGPSGRFRWAVFNEPHSARADLQQLLDEDDVVADQRRAAAALRNSGVEDAEQLVLVCNSWALAMHRVGPGESGPLAGTRFYNEWVAMMQNNVGTRLEIHGAVMEGQPMIMWP
ncbi:hypothetical protein DY245_25700 [Streptomyces inhibens]|uniref:Uncharacterized protein n=1 Tax=Streptomyces inhibens TaxID=2293571 RepID=A0A371PYX8_STRIH|nr:hypothetical protein DY245_25700 [Streptomyces inhibens]